MTWVSVASNGGMGIEAQQLLRWSGVPVACVKKRSEHWECSLMNAGGISTTPLELPIAMELESIKSHCEELLVQMGWTRPEVKTTNRIAT